MWDLSLLLSGILQKVVMFVVKIIGVSLSKSHTSMTALQDVCVCVCLYVCLSAYVRPYTLNEWKRRYTYISNFHTC